MKLHEVFNKPVKHSGREFYIDGDGPYTVTVSVPDGNHIPDEVVADWVDESTPHEPRIIDVGFWYQDAGNITGFNKPFKVFSTVISIIRDAVQELNADFVTFSAKESEPTRVKLYHRLAKSLGSDYRAFEDVRYDDILYVVKV